MINGLGTPFAPEKVPTAKHLFVLGHDTAMRRARTAPTGLGVNVIDHLPEGGTFPFHRSANVLTVPAASVQLPTAIQIVGVGQSIASSLVVNP
jgi:hypothetical protein